MVEERERAKNRFFVVKKLATPTDPRRAAIRSIATLKVNPKSDMTSHFLTADYTDRDGFSPPMNTNRHELRSLQNLADQN